MKPYIQSAWLNGAPFGNTYLSHSQITAGGEIRIQMTSAPDTAWGSWPTNRPPSALSKLIESLKE